MNFRRSLRSPFLFKFIDKLYKSIIIRTKNNEEMESIIITYDKDEYSRRFEEWLKAPYGSYDDGYAAKRFVKKLEKVIG